MSQRIAVFCLSKSNLQLAQKISVYLKAELHVNSVRIQPEEDFVEADVSFTDAMEHLSNLFRNGVAIIGVCASAILIRGVAKLLSNKLNEPPVIAVGQEALVAGANSFVVPLLGGHHGANELAQKISTFLGTLPAITSTGDLRFGISLDDPPEGFALMNPVDVKLFTSELLSGKTVKLTLAEEDKFPKFFEWLKESRLPFSDKGDLRISIKSEEIFASTEHLVYEPIEDLPGKNFVVGVGCERGTDPEIMHRLVINTLEENYISPESVALVVSIDIKADEPAIHELAKNLSKISGFKCHLRFFDAKTLEKQTPRLKNPSELVFKEVGCHGVAEGSALAAVGDSGELFVPKVKSASKSGNGQATCAIAKSIHFIQPHSIGKPRGTLFVVGTGPGNSGWRVFESEKILKIASDWVGYGKYIDLIEDLHKDQKIHRYDLGQEEKRVQHAIELATQGKTVALISSGDPSIYAMGSLVFELMEKSSTEWKRIRVEILPGISAIQAASAKVGAFIGHDFCTISLSDLLTSWKQIERRIIAAAEGDFVIAFYNPVSMNRKTQLAKARNILLQHRHIDTPVILARNIGRDEEHVKVISLNHLDSKDVDMLTLVLVGSSQTKQFNLPSGEVRAYTPRGYQIKDNVEKVKY